MPVTLVLLLLAFSLVACLYCCWNRYSPISCAERGHSRTYLPLSICSFVNSGDDARGLVGIIADADGRQGLNLEQGYEPGPLPNVCLPGTGWGDAAHLRHDRCNRITSLADCAHQRSFAPSE